MSQPQKLGQADSQRLALLRFPLVVCVVFLHSAETTVHLRGQDVGVPHTSFAVAFVCNLISQCLASAAVPLFFLISGYLLYQGFEWSWAAYRDKLASRSKTLLLPFLFWNALTLLLWTSGQHWSVTQHLFSGNHHEMPNLAWDEGVAAVFGVGRAPVAYQFWFLRDLMLLVLLTPLIAWLLRDGRLALPTLGALILCRALDLWGPAVRSCEATTFFCIGAFLAIRQLSPFVLDRFAMPSMLAYPVVLVLDALSLTLDGRLSWVHKLDVFLGPLFFLCLSACVRRHAGLSRALVALSPAAFFVFAAHEPLLSLSRKLAYKLWTPAADAVVLSLYFAIPATLITVLLLARQALMRWAPAFTSTVTGGR